MMALRIHGTLSKRPATIVVGLLLICLLILLLLQIAIENGPGRIQYRLCRVDGRPLENARHRHPDDDANYRAKPTPHTGTSNQDNNHHHQHQNQYGQGQHSQTPANVQDNINKPKKEHEETGETRATHLTKQSLFKANHLLLNFTHAKDREVKQILRPDGAGILWTSFSPGTTSNTTTTTPTPRRKDENAKPIHVHGAQTLHYSGPLKPGEKLPIGISMFHAMHCLLYLRELLQDHVLHVVPPSDDGHTATRHRHDPETHIPHCWSYITQQVMCLGDTTLEPPWIEREGGGGGSGKIVKMGIDGHGVHHSCKDLGPLGELVGRVVGGEVFEDWGWRDGQRVEDVFS